MTAEAPPIQGLGIRWFRDRPGVVLAISGAVMVGALVLVLQAEGWLVVSWRRSALVRIVPEHGLAFIAPLPGAPGPTDPSPAVVYEDERRLGPGNSSHDEIRANGRGRFSVWGARVYLSSSDGTDPRSNGRRYTLASPRAVPPALAWPLLLLAIAGTVVAAARLPLRRAFGALADHAPLIGAGLIGLGFAIPRLPFVVHFPLPDVAVDFHSYFQVTQQIQRGEWPDFSVRTPGYPIFLTLVFAICDRLMAVIVAQNLVTLGSALAAYTCFVRADRRLAVPAAIGLFAFVSSTDSGWFDEALMSESLYSSLLVLALGSLTLGIVKDRPLALAGASFAMAAALATRPAGMFFLAVYVVVVGYLLIEWRRGLRPRRSLLAFAAPLAAMLLALCIYNRARIGVFTPSPFGEMNVVGAVATYAEEDPSLSPEMNDAIRAIRAGVSPADRRLVETSWDVRKLFGAFARNFDSAIYTHLAKVKGSYLDKRSAFRTLARVAISRHPDRYLKFVASGLYNFYVGSPGHPALPYGPDELGARYARVYVRRDYRQALGDEGSRGVLKEYWDPPPQPHIRTEGSSIVVDQTWARTMHERWDAVHRVVFGNALWVIAPLLLSGTAIWRAWATRLRHRGTVAVLLQLMCLLGAGLVVALVQLGMTRYAGPTLFIVYLAPMQLALLLLRPAEHGSLRPG